MAVPHLPYRGCCLNKDVLTTTFLSKLVICPMQAQPGLTTLGGSRPQSKDHFHCAGLLEEAPNNFNQSLQSYMGLESFIDCSQGRVS